METGAGDRLARGWPSATFGPSTGVTQKQWDAAFEDFDPEEYKKGGKNASKSDANTGDKERTRV